MNERIKRLLQWADGGTAGPLEIRLETTYRCNLACLSCCRRGNTYDFTKEIPRQRLLDIIDQSAQLGAQKWHLTGGGEPFIRKETTLQILEKIKHLGMIGQITTNGTLFDERIVKRLVEIQFDEVQFSIDGSDSATQDFLRNRPRTFEKNLIGLQLFQKWKKRLGTDTPRIIFSTVISNRNYSKLKDIILFAHTHGVVNVIAEPVTIHSDLTRIVELNETQKRELPGYLTEAQELADHLGVRTNMKHLVDPRYVEKTCINEVICENVREEHQAAEKSPTSPEPADKDSFYTIPCYAPWLDMWILPDGLTGPCRVVAGDWRYDCDSIASKDLPDIWFGEKYQWFRRVMRESIPADCRRCCANQVLTVRQIQDEMRQMRREHAERR